MKRLVFTQSALDDLEYLRKADRRVVLDAIDQQLTTEPLQKTKNRKPLRPNDLSAWELRVAGFRVFYDVDSESQEVIVKAVGWKEHNRLYIRGAEFRL
jgi:mRNA-degrading endonuclease RelE of RelBE toxin-antitoxin system